MSAANVPELTCVVLTCTPKKSPAEASSWALGSEILQALAAHHVPGSMQRVVDHDVRF